MKAEKIFAVKEIFYSLEGEGARSGRASLFVRFAGCNLWNGLEKNRANAQCGFCDTDFVGTDGQLGGKYTLKQLSQLINCTWLNNTSSEKHKYVVFTGGEPGLQLNSELVIACQKNNFETAIETNGTVNIPSELDWICISPKANTQIVLKKADEIKIVYPQEGLNPISFSNFSCDNFYIQPKQARAHNHFKEAVEFCKRNPKWRLSLQTHKILNIP